MKIKHRIVNVVASTNIGTELKLHALKQVLKENSEYEPDIYFALIYRLKEPKLSILVNSSGKIIFTGAKSVADIKRARDIFFKKLINLGYCPKKGKISIQNIVVSAKIEHVPHLEKILGTNRYSIEHEPETFPGIILRYQNPKFTALVFKNGEVLIVGLKSFKYINLALKLVDKIMRRP
jgi:transcription initiation factor TFIID TATA-box-binding protein